MQYALLCIMNASHCNRGLQCHGRTECCRRDSLHGERDQPVRRDLFQPRRFFGLARRCGPGDPERDRADVPPADPTCDLYHTSIPHIAHSDWQYRWDRLADTDHVVSVQNLATDANVYLDLDYAVVSRYGSVASLASTTSPSASGTALPLASSATSTSTTAANTTTMSTRSSPLVGALAGVLVFLLALAAGLWVLLRRLRQRRRRRAGVQVVEIRESRIGGGDLSFLSPNQLIVNPFSNPSPRSAECVPLLSPLAALTCGAGSTRSGTVSARRPRTAKTRAAGGSRPRPRGGMGPRTRRRRRCRVRRRPRRLRPLSPTTETI
jgi:hypothetical protein